MIVDDATFMRRILREIVEGIGLQVVAEAENGEEAVKLFRVYRPTLVTMDLTMPVMDGMTALKKIVEIDHRATIVVCSALGQRDIVIQSIAAGARDFIVKPLQEDRVRHTIQNVLEMGSGF
ncbi:response regulator [Brevibacillus humidisoli]|uniref:response regulator n=1 Tax=Brevibacillus humidisoli TaxID=2895522 RepID=UPI001E55F7C8|nr:response regulator [Brevibacillus humidisoli]UFJ43433.1 response regulator [Brevibacillus humidisoli]